MDWRGFMFFLMTVLLSLWFLLSIANQFPSVTLIARNNRSQLIPYWVFFCPIPANSDYHLIYRVLRTGSRVQEWQEITWNQPNPVLSSVWNPELRIQLVLVHSAMSISAWYSAKQASHHVGPLPPYHFLLNMTKARCLGEGDGFVQFAIVEAPSFELQKQPSLLLRSSFHALS